MADEKADIQWLDDLKYNLLFASQEIQDVIRIAHKCCFIDPIGKPSIGMLQGAIAKLAHKIKSTQTTNP